MSIEDQLYQAKQQLQHVGRKVSNLEAARDSYKQSLSTLRDENIVLQQEVSELKKELAVTRRKLTIAEKKLEEGEEDASS